MKNLIQLSLLAAVFVLSLSSCEQPDRKGEVVINFANLVLDNYQAAHQDALSMQSAIKRFTASPSEATLNTAKGAWLKSRESYGITEVFRFQGGPIDIIDGDDGPEARLNAWPMDENYIDYVEGAPDAGIINDTTKAITKAVLVAANEEGGEENVSIGYHAIEFLLWGQDLTAPSAKKAGNRVYTDYTADGTAANPARRKQYLELCAELLVTDLQLLVDQWKEDGAYRQQFLAMDAKVAIGKMMTGMATLAKSELAGERIFVAYDNRDQEDEHSCFSDNTHRDTRLNLQGIKNVYYALIGDKANYSIHDLVLQQDAQLAAEISATFERAEKAVDATATPFDFAISDDMERPKVLKAVDALRALGNQLSEVGKAIGVEVGTEL